MFLKTQSPLSDVGTAVLLRNEEITSWSIISTKMMMDNSMKDWVKQNGSKRPHITHQC